MTTAQRRRCGEMVLATKVENIFADDVPDGAYREKDGRFLCVCPCGCGSMMALPINIETHPSWSFDGNWDAPTLAPSIRDMGGCYFHGFLRQGIWSFCEDSGVKP